MSSSASPQAVACPLANLEAGRKPGDNHIALGPHYRLYPACVYESQADRNTIGISEPDGSEKVNYAYYPVISDQHPFIVALNEGIETYGSIEAIPDAEFPTLDSFSVLIKSKKFRRIGDIPDDWPLHQDLHGLVINSINSLDGEEKNLLRDSFPSMRFDDLVIIEHDRKPASNTRSLGMMAGGFGITAFGLWLGKASILGGGRPPQTRRRSRSARKRPEPADEP